MTFCFPSTNSIQFNPLLGLTRDRVIGENWIEVKPPAMGVRIVQVSVGTNAVWCVTSDNHVWFRRGIKGELAGISEDAALGNGWVEMVGNMSNVAVAPNDQVFAVGSENRSIYFRSGVTDSDLTGKTWRQVQCPMQLSRACSMASVHSRNSGSSSGGSPNSRHRSLNHLARQQHSQERARVEEPSGCIIEEQSRSAPTHNLKHKPELWKKPLNSSPGEGEREGSSLGHHRLAEADEGEAIEQMAFSAPIPEIHEARPRQSSSSSSSTSRHHRRSWSPMRSMGSVVGTEAMPDSADGFQCDTSRDSGVFGEEDVVDSQYWAETQDTVWTLCAAGAVYVDVTAALPNWFNESASAVQQAGQHELTEGWRLGIVAALAEQANRVNAMEERERYELAVDTSSWVKTGEARMARLNGQFEECLIELEWVSGRGGGGGGKGDLDSGTLTILNPDAVTTKLQFPLSEITAVMCVSEPGAPRLAIHSPRLGGSAAVIKLQFAGDTDMEDWLSHLTSVCCKINGVAGRPSNGAVWTTTSLGDVFVFDAEYLKQQQWTEKVEEEGRRGGGAGGKYVQEYDLNVTETPYLVSVHNGMGAGSEIEVTGCIYDDADYVRFDLQGQPTVKHRQSQRHVQLHLNPRFNEKEIVLNTMEASEWQTELRETKMVFLPGQEFHLKIW